MTIPDWVDKLADRFAPDEAFDAARAAWIDELAAINAEMAAVLDEGVTRERVAELGARLQRWADTPPQRSPRREPAPVAPATADREARATPCASGVVPEAKP